MRYIVTQEELRDWKSRPFEVKLEMSKERIRSWYEAWDGMISVSFSGGLDSTMLLHLVRSELPDVPGVFVNTGTEYPEMIKFIKTVPNVVWLRGKLSFRQVIEWYGYPIISKDVARGISDCQNPTGDNDFTINLRRTGKRADGVLSKSSMIPKKYQYLIDSGIKVSHKCCEILKEKPLRDYLRKTGRKPIIGTMAEDSRRRELGYMRKGCNAFDSKNPRSTPIAFWTKEDVWTYIKKYNVKYCELYDQGINRTGCMFCMFGLKFDGPENRFVKMRDTHPQHWRVCMNQLGYNMVLNILKMPTGLKIDDL